MHNKEQSYTLRCFKAYAFIACLWGGILTVAGCRKIDPIRYQGKDVLYFLNAGGPPYEYERDSLSTGWYMSPVVISFFQESTDTVYLIRRDLAASSTERDALKVRLAGMAKPFDRKFSITVTGSGAKYCILPPADALKIGAGRRFCPLDLRLLRPPVTDTNSYSVTVSLVDNEYFTPTLHTWHQFQYVFGNIVEKPKQGWDPMFGPFSREKLVAMFDAISWAGPVVREKLKQHFFSKIYNQDEFKIPPVFEPFTIESLYQLLFQSKNNGSIRARLDMWESMAGITKDYLAYRKKQGNPVLDSNGQEIQFP
ncbi:DUF4843 domain-containing protein [Chitinophaga polysaccharea]|uniref:DUF4843 domain-containing protein n=1 Tax=Chitinophaga polysaccharea TaxID=1293035 RepID=UPI001159F5A4|nr:DUF4843 domain-containing protein [Chitinophaga polysaccharea]